MFADANGIGDDVRCANGIMLASLTGWGRYNDEREKKKDERRKTLRVLII
ncbi:MAG: hypothetical protein IJS90_00935 [Clostridia bacterium]|nr:hypothetical protein [Clostridia bacterium]